MASTYTNSLQIQLIGNGEQSGTWGTTTNTNWNLIEQAVAGVLTITMSNANYTLTVVNGASDQARNMVINVTGTNSGIYQVIAPLVPKMYLVTNNTTGGNSITFGGTTGSLVTISNGASALVYCDGTNFYAAAFSTIASGVSSFQTSLSGLTPSSTTTGAINLGGTLGAASGGTGLTSSGAYGNFLVSNGSGWVSSPLSSSGIATLSGTQTFTGPNTFSITPVVAGYNVLTTNTGATLSNNNTWTGTNNFTNTTTFNSAPTVGSYSVLTTNTGGSLTGTNSWSGQNTFANNGSGNGTPIYGATNGNSASAGYVGELLTANQSSKVAVTNNTDTVITQLTLTPGDWDVRSIASAYADSPNYYTAFITSLSTGTSIGQSTGFYGASPSAPTYGAFSTTYYANFNVSSNTTIYLLTRITGGSGTGFTGTGSIYARRMR